MNKKITELRQEERIYCRHNWVKKQQVEYIEYIVSSKTGDLCSSAVPTVHT